MHIFQKNRPQVVITMGDPAGIGPEIIRKSMASPEIEGLAVFFVFGDKNVLNLPESDFIKIIDPSDSLMNVFSGKTTKEQSEKTLLCLKEATGFIKKLSDDIPKAMVTAPLSKEKIAEIEPGFIGHTEYLQQACSKDFVTMVLLSEKFAVIPVTRHIPLSEVANKLTVESIVKTLNQVSQNQRILTKKKEAKIGVTALNPHAGEGGKIGTEEIEIITPAIEIARKSYPLIEGPIPADVIFYKALKGDIDIIVGMYHDQVLASFKAIDFDSGVNMTLGLDFIRTSPDHGTAFDIAGKNIANPESMIQAIKLAVRASKVNFSLKK